MRWKYSVQHCASMLVHIILNEDDDDDDYLWLMVAVSAGVEDNITPRLHYTLLSNDIGVTLYFILYHYTLYIMYT